MVEELIILVINHYIIFIIYSQKLLIFYGIINKIFSYINFLNFVVSESFLNFKFLYIQLIYKYKLNNFYLKNMLYNI